jgi:NAD(P)-dependent dehydrogenase (short-subunit alcohol dehydrogenase family)
MRRHRTSTGHGVTPSAAAQARAEVAERNSTRAAGRGDVPRHALVTGGGSGIGLACAEHLAAGGYVVTIVGRRAPVLERAADRLRGAGRAVRWVAADVCDERQIADAVDAAADGGALTAVVAAAGTGWVAPLTEIPLAAWHHVIDVNLTGTFLTLRAAAPHMAAAGLGSFVAISSVNAERTSRFHIPYCATKAGVDMLVRCAADELGHAGIRVNAVRPGLVPTELSSTLVDDDEVRSDFLEQMPLHRLGSPDEIAAAVGFLCSPAASWITGVCLPVVGGHHLRRGERFDSLMRHDHPEPAAWWGIAPKPGTPAPDPMTTPQEGSAHGS